MAKDPPYLKLNQLAKRYSVDRSTIYRWMEREIFPRPIHFSESCPRWHIETIEKWEADVASKEIA